MHGIQQMLEEKRAKARLGGGQKRIDAQHAKGKLSALASSTCGCHTAAS